MRKRSVLGIAALFSALLLAHSAPHAWLGPDAGAEGGPDSDKEMVVLLHGLGRSNSAMWLLATRLERAGYRVERVGYRSLNRSPDEIIAEITEKISDCCADHAERVHFAGHSLGGLLIRAYLQDNHVEHLGRVVLIGTPNQGTTIVDRYRDRWWMRLLGATTLALGTDENSLPNSLKPPDYPVGVIAGVSSDHGNDDVLPGEDDGLVPVLSTHLEGMRDFVLVRSSHSMMRYDREVALHVVAFLRDGSFERPTQAIATAGTEAD